MEPLLVRRLNLQFDPEMSPLVDIREPFGIPTGVSLLVAPSGSGKTSLLRLMSGWYEAGGSSPSSFCIEASFDPLRDVDFIGNHQTLLPWYSVKRNISMRGGSADSDVVVDYWRLAGLKEDSMEQYPYELSLGMYKRAEFVAALCGSAQLLLLDEMFSSLDPISRDLCLDLVRRLHPDNKAVVVTTHTPEAFPNVTSRFGFHTNQDGTIIAIKAVA